jgi:hypothetical protein
MGAPPSLMGGSTDCGVIRPRVTSHWKLMFLSHLADEGVCQHRNQGSIMWRTLLVPGVVALVGWILLGAGCTFDEPVNPRWDVQLVIPISEQRYQLIDLVDSAGVLGSEHYGIGMTTSDSLLYFFYKDSIPYTTVADSLYIIPQQDSVTTSLGNAYFEAGVDALVQFTVSDIAPELVPYHGQTIPAPPFSFDEITKQIPPFSNFDHMEVDSGYAHYTVTNTLPVPLDVVHLKIFHTENPSYILVEQDLIGLLPPGGAVIDSVNMEGMQVVQRLSTSVSGSSPGSPTPVLIDTTNSLDIHVHVGRIKVREAYGYIPEQNVTTDTTVELRSDHIVRQAKISRGSIYLHTVNETEMPATVTVEVCNFTSAAGDPLADSAYLPPMTQIDHTVPLGGYTLTIPDPSHQELNVHVVARFDSTEEWAHYQAGQDAYATFYTDTLYLEFLDGVVDTIEVKVGPEEQEVDPIPEDWDQFNIVEATMKVRLDSDIGANILTDLSLIAVRDGIPQDSILVHEVIVPNRDTLLTVEGLETLINTRPNLMIIQGSAATYGDMYLHAENYVSGEVVVDVPLSFTLEPITIEPDAEPPAVEALSDKCKRGVLEATYTNHLPMSGWVEIHVTNPSGTGTLPEVVLERPTIVNGRVVEPMESEIVITLEDYHVDLFKLPYVVQPLYHLDGTGGDTLSAYATDYISFSAIARFIYEIDTAENWYEGISP